MTAVARYLDKRAVHGMWAPPHGETSPAGIRQVVAIPVLAEFDTLFDTLRDLAANDPAQLAETAVVCVVNNRAPEIAGESDCADNQRTLAALPEFARTHPQLRLAWIDAASPGRTLGPKDGVGLARKIGLDWGLALMLEAGAASGALICLDADTRVPPNYLRAISDFFGDGTRWAAVVDYAHPIDGPPEVCLPILSYELFLRYQELAWRHAGSPYAYPAIGSTMACSGTAYAAAGGMNRRQAGEDFYFLQQLAKTGRVDRIRETAVAPSGRASHRVPFGTGRKVGAYAADPEDAWRTYHPETFQVLRRWLETVRADRDAPGSVLLERAAAIAPELAAYLAEQGFAASWDRILKNSPDPAQRARQFHQWFDGFRTLKLAHHLRDHGYPRGDLFEALGAVMAWQGIAAPFPMEARLRVDIEKQRALIGLLRSWRPYA